MKCVCGSEKLRKKLKDIVPIESFHVRKKLGRLGKSYMIPVSKDVAEFMPLKKDTQPSQNRLPQ